MNRRNFSLLAVTSFLGLAATKATQADILNKPTDTDGYLTGVFHTSGSGSGL